MARVGFAASCSVTTGIKKVHGFRGTITVGTLPATTSLATTGSGYSALLASGSVDCWGDNTYGELGNGTTTGPDCSGTCNPMPGPVSGITTARRLVGGIDGYCALLASGSVDCWGENIYGDLGNGTTTGPDDCSGYPCNPTPGPVSGVTTAISLVTGYIGYSAVLTSGSVDCWGDNTYGELGNGTTSGPDCSGTCNPMPGPVSGVTTARSLVSGNVPLYGYCALLASGSVDCWGDNNYGQLGNGTTSGPDCSGQTCNPMPGLVSGVTTARSLVSGFLDGFSALLASGSVDCWGDNTYGQLGNGTTTGPGCSGTCNPTPGPVSGVTTAHSVVSADDGYCALLTSGSVDCWGNNAGGALGNGTTTGPGCSGTCNPTPGPVSGVTTATSLFTDFAGYSAVLTSGSVDCWGENSTGQLGNGTTTGPGCSGTCNPTPGPVSGVTTARSLFSGGTEISVVNGYCAVLASGSVVCWGDNTTGELGNGTTGDANPTPGLVN